MPSLPFGKTSYKRDNGDMPRLRLVNMVAEPAPTGEQGVLLSRLPLVQDGADIGTGPIHGIFQKDGVLGGDTFVVSGSTLYRGAVALGVVGGSGPVRWAASASEIVVTRGDQAYSYNGTNFQTIALPDGDRPVIGFRSVAFVNGLFVFVTITDPGVAGVPDHYWFWSAINDARTIDDLDFAAAESEPDALLDVVADGAGNIYLLGQGSGEIWALTGAANLPFSRISQRALGRGVAATGCAEIVDGTLYFIDNEFIVCRMEEIAKRISDHGLEERIRKSATRAAFKYGFEGHLFFVILLADEALEFDVASGTWPELATYGRDMFVGKCAVTIDGVPHFGTDFTSGGVVATFGTHGTPEHGAVAFERIFHAGQVIPAGALIVDNVLVFCNVGATTLDIGPGADPLLEMRASRDGGRSWTPWRSAKLGEKGQYRKQVRFGRLGSFGPPGILLEFRCTENVPLRISDVRYNESLSGRGW